MAVSVFTCLPHCCCCSCCMSLLSQSSEHLGFLPLTSDLGTKWTPPSCTNTGTHFSLCTDSHNLSFDSLKLQLFGSLWTETSWYTHNPLATCWATYLHTIAYFHITLWQGAAQSKTLIPIFSSLLVMFLSPLVSIWYWGSSLQSPNL